MSLAAQKPARLALWAAVMAVPLVAFGCGGQARSAQEPSSPATGAFAHEEPASEAPAYTEQLEELPADGAGGMARPEAPPNRAGPAAPRPAPQSPSRYARPPTSVGELDRDDERSRSELEDFLVAEAALMASGASCLDACRALRSMQRAVSRLCELAEGEEGKSRCTAATERYRAARERVRGACTRCQAGPPLDRDAPVNTD